MKRRIKSSALLFIVLLFSTITLAAPAPSADSEQIAQLLDLLGVRAMLEQTPAILAAAAEAQMKFSQAQPKSGPAPSAKEIAQAANWRRDLDVQLKPQLLVQEVTRYLRERYSAETFRQAQQRLQEPLAKRARYFDLAMTQPGVEKNLRVFLLQNHAAQNTAVPTGAEGATDTRNTEARRKLLREIDAATASSLLMATLQSALAARVHQAAETGAIDAKMRVDAQLLADEIAERQRYLAPLAVDYLLYDYRYLRDDELGDYRDLLRDDAVQALLDLSRKALLNAIVGDLTPPPITPQPSPPR